MAVVVRDESGLVVAAAIRSVLCKSNRLFPLSKALINETHLLNSKKKNERNGLIYNGDKFNEIKDKNRNLGSDLIKACIETHEVIC